MPFEANKKYNRVVVCLCFDAARMQSYLLTSLNMCVVLTLRRVLVLRTQQQYNPLFSLNQNSNHLDIDLWIQSSITSIFGLGTKL